MVSQQAIIMGAFVCKQWPGAIDFLLLKYVMNIRVSALVLPVPVCCEQSIVSLLLLCMLHCGTINAAVICAKCSHLMLEF